jgi:Arc/MetJ family transcription regulator
MFKNYVKIDDELYAKARRCAELAGYSSADEFIQHIVEKEINQLMGGNSEEDSTPEEIKKRLQGLGYIE